MASYTKISDADRRSRSAKIDAIVLYGTFGLLMFGPAAFGAVEPWSIFVIEAGSVVLALLWLAKLWIDREVSIIWNPVFLPISAFGALLLGQILFRLSGYRHETVSQTLLYCAYGTLCFLVTQVLIRSSQARKIAVILCLYGFAMGAFALMQGLTPNGKLYWLRQPRMGGWIYGPYVNHNHYAGLMELLVPIPLIIAFSRVVPDKERFAAGVAAAIMVATIFLSGSRGGMIAILVELMVFCTVMLRRKKGAQIAIGAAAFVLVLVGLLAWLGGKELTSRMSTISAEAKTEISGGTRLSIDRDALQMFRHKPVLGWGLGTFPVVYPQFRSFYTNFFVNEAHNDYLQLLAEMGILGFAVMVWFVIVVYRRAFRKIGKWTSDVSSAATLACTLSFTGILVHSFFDFNLQIPANASLFYVFATIAAAPAFLQRSRKRKPIPAEEEFLPASEVV